MDKRWVPGFFSVSKQLVYLLYLKAVPLEIFRLKLNHGEGGAPAPDSNVSFAISSQFIPSLMLYFTVKRCNRNLDFKTAIEIKSCSFLILSYTCIFLHS